MVRETFRSRSGRWSVELWTAGGVRQTSVGGKFVQTGRYHSREVTRYFPSWRLARAAAKEWMQR